MLYHRKEHNASNKAMTTTDTPRWTVTQFNSALLEHDGETCNEIFCISKDEAECLVDLLNELTERAERLRSTMRSFILVSPIEAQRMEKIEAEAEKLRLTMRSFIDFMDENLGTTADWPMEAAFDDEETCQRHCDHLNAMKRIVKPDDIN